MKEPLYEVVKRYIKDQIDAGVFAPGDKIPTEMDLAAQFNTSRQTVTKALRDLVLDDLVERSPRSGTFVKPPKSQSSLLDLQNIATFEIAYEDKIQNLSLFLNYLEKRLKKYYKLLNLLFQTLF